MFKMGHSSLVIISGLVWLFVGLVLLTLGLTLLSGLLDPVSLAYQQKAPILNLFSDKLGPESVVLGLIVLGLLAGNFKGRIVLGKAAAKGIDRLRAFPNPTPLSNIYSKKYYLLLGSMVLLGMVVKFLPTDIRGLVDVTIGTALINGSLYYFKDAFLKRVQ